MGWLVVLIIVSEWIVYGFLVRNWHRQVHLRLAQTADMFAPVPDLVAFVAVHLVAAGWGLFLALHSTPSWLTRALVFAAVFWVTAKLLRFVSLLVVVRYAGISPVHLLRLAKVEREQAIAVRSESLDNTVAMRSESLRLMEQLGLDEGTKWKLKGMAMLGEWVNEEEAVEFLRYVLRLGRVLNRATLDTVLQEFRTEDRPPRS